MSADCSFTEMCSECGELFDKSDLFMGLCAECYNELWFGPDGEFEAFKPKAKYDDEEV